MVSESSTVKQGRHMLGVFRAHDSPSLILNTVFARSPDRPGKAAETIVFAITVMCLKTGIIKTFSIPQQAELHRFSLMEIESRFLELENTLLLSVAAEIESRKVAWILGWNSFRDFSSIIHRCQVHQIDILEVRQTRLEDILSDIFGEKFANVPRFSEACRLNGIKLTAYNEVIPFSTKLETGDLHHTGILKVKGLMELLRLAHENRLKIATPMVDRYGGWFETIFTQTCENRYFVGISALLSFLYLVFPAIHRLVH